MDHTVDRPPELRRPRLDSSEVSDPMKILGSLAADYAELEDLEIKIGRVLKRINSDLDAFHNLSENP